MFSPHNLVLYKTRPARVLQVADKIEIESVEGHIHRVRPKDIYLLHPGPLKSLQELTPAPTEHSERDQAWALLSGTTTTLTELTDLIFGRVEPTLIWQVWQWVQDDLHFHGKPEQVLVRTAEEVALRQQQRQKKATAQQNWQAFIQRLHQHQLIAADHALLATLEPLALGQTTQVSPILRELNRDSTPQNAHALLLKASYWPKTYNPYPQRFGVMVDQPQHSIPELNMAETRRDLTYLASYAIDDEGNEDPDDAISLDPDRPDTIWVHVADVAALVPAHSELDQLAQGRVANLYVPELTSTMLPLAVTHRLGLGLQPVSPALSFCLQLDAEGQVQLCEVTPSWIRATRLSYAAVEQQLTTEPFATLYQYSQRYQARRMCQGALVLNFPEVKIKAISLTGPDIRVIPFPPYKSRDLVAEMMLMTGEAVALFAAQHQIPLAFSTQPVPENVEQPASLAAAFAVRKQLKRSQFKTAPGPHGGLGLSHYTQVTSPLRRYLDLVAHQQLRAFIHNQPLLDEAALLERIASVEALLGNIRRAERFSNQHWLLLYLQQQRDWTGEGVVIEDKGYNQRATVLIPAFAMEVNVSLKQNPIILDSVIPLKITGVDIPELTAYFRAL